MVNGEHLIIKSYLNKATSEHFEMPFHSTLNVDK